MVANYFILEPMMSDTHTVVSNQSWGSRLSGAFKGIVFGLVLFIAAFPVLFANEGRAVKTFKSLQEGAGIVVSVGSEKVVADNEGKLIHVVGKADTKDRLTDDAFNIDVSAIKLAREVEMYQWIERESSDTKKQLGGGTETVTTYTYTQGWSKQAIDSASFAKPAGHRNPGSIPFAAYTHAADNVSLGAFTLSASLIDSIDNFAPLAIPSSAPAVLPNAMKRMANGYYQGKDPSSPAIGDVKVSFAVVSPSTISVVARQINHTFEPYRAAAGGKVELLQIGTHSAEAMFNQSIEDNEFITWLIRLGGFLLMLIGVNMLIRPLVVLADVLPLLGDLIGAGTGAIAFLIAALLSLLTIAFAWLAYRPLMAGALLAVAAAIVVLVVLRQRKKAQD